MYKDDAILADKEMNRYSLDIKNQDSALRQTQFTLCSDRMEQMFPGYQLDKKCRVIPGKSTPTINFSELKQLLLSKDKSNAQGFRALD